MIRCVLGFILFFSGCTTVMESMSPLQNQPLYQTTKNSNGETVYRQRFGYQQPPTAPALYAPQPKISSTVNFSDQETKPNSKRDWISYFEGASTKGHLHLGLHAGYRWTDYLIPFQISWDEFPSVTPVAFQAFYFNN